MKYKTIDRVWWISVSDTEAKETRAIFPCDHYMSRKRALQEARKLCDAWNAEHDRKMEIAAAAVTMGAENANIDYEV